MVYWPAESPRPVLHHPEGRLGQHVCIDGYLHRSPAQPDAAISFISSIVSGLRVFPASKPMKPLMLPGGRATLIRISPPGILSKWTFSPGLIPRCCNTSFLRVTCPFEVTVNVPMSDPLTEWMLQSKAVLHYCREQLPYPPRPHDTVFGSDADMRAQP